MYTSFSVRRGPGDAVQPAARRACDSCRNLKIKVRCRDPRWISAPDDAYSVDRKSKRPVGRTMAQIPVSNVGTTKNRCTFDDNPRKPGRRTKRPSQNVFTFESASHRLDDPRSMAKQPWTMPKNHIGPSAANLEVATVPATDAELLNIEGTGSRFLPSDASSKPSQRCASAKFGQDYDDTIAGAYLLNEANNIQDIQLSHIDYGLFEWDTRKSAVSAAQGRASDDFETDLQQFFEKSWIVFPVLSHDLLQSQ
jgi:hypothetical protein